MIEEEQPSCSKRARYESKAVKTKERYHDTAMFLNNIGIEFLMQDCYTQAVESFQDAYFLIRSSTLSLVIISDEIQMIMNRAFNNIANPRREDSSHLVLDVLEMSNDDGKLHIRNADRSDVLQHILETAPSSFVAFPIQLREQPKEFLRQQVAIVAHNLAIANYCRGKNSSDSWNLEVAFRFSEHAALTFLAMQYKTSSDTRLLSLTIAVLNSFLHLLQETERNDEVLRCYEILGQCRDVACDAIERLHHLHTLS